MKDIGLSASDEELYSRGLVLPHPMRLKVGVLDRDEDPIGWLTAPASRVKAGGQVAIDTNAAITRQAQLTVADPKGRLDFDPRSPSDEALFIDKLVTIIREDFIAELDDYIPCPVFKGPLGFYDWQGGEVRIEALGMEAWLLEPHAVWESEHYRKGKNVVAAIREFLADAGVSHFDFPSQVRRTFPEPVSVARIEDRWPRAKRWANGINRQLFFDGSMRARLRKFPDEPVIVYRTEGDDDGLKNVFTPPSYRYDPERFRNVIEVLGPEPDSKKKKRIRYVARPEKNDPLSPESLAWNGKPRYLVERIENRHIKRRSDAKEIGDRVLAARLRAALEATFEAVGDPRLEELDVGLLKSDDRRIEFVHREFTVPLSSQGRSAVGVLKRQSIRRGGRR